jgi:hypothetical protein
LDCKQTVGQTLTRSGEEAEVPIVSFRNHVRTAGGPAGAAGQVPGRPGPAREVVMAKSSNKKNQSGKHQKYKIQKKHGVESQNKISKSEKVKERRKGSKVVEIKKKDIGVPDRNKLLKGMEAQKKKATKESIQEILDRKRSQEKSKMAALPQSLQLAALKASAANRLATFDMHTDELGLEIPNSAPMSKPGDVEHTRRAFYRELHKILETADVILEVITRKPTHAAHSYSHSLSKKNTMIGLRHLHLMRPVFFYASVYFLMCTCFSPLVSSGVGRAGSSRMPAGGD